MDEEGVPLSQQRPRFSVQILSRSGLAARLALGMRSLLRADVQVESEADGTEACRHQEDAPNVNSRRLRVSESALETTCCFLHHVIVGHLLCLSY